MAGSLRDLKTLGQGQRGSTGVPKLFSSTSQVGNYWGVILRCAPGLLQGTGSECRQASSFGFDSGTQPVCSHVGKPCYESEQLSGSAVGYMLENPIQYAPSGKLGPLSEEPLCPAEPGAWSCSSWPPIMPHCQQKDPCSASLQPLCLSLPGHFRELVLEGWGAKEGP